MIIKLKYKLIILFLGLITSVNYGNAQDEIIEGINILQQPIMAEADSNVVLEYGYGWLDGYNVVYNCIISKVDSTELESIRLIVSNESDTLLVNNYSSSSTDINLQINNDGTSATLFIDTLMYSSDYLFNLQLLEEDSLIQEINYIENFN